MANVDAARGLVPVKFRGGHPYNGVSNMYVIQADNTTVVYIGDTVVLDGRSGDAGEFVNGIDTEGMPSIAKGAVSGKSVGAVVGFLPLQTDLEARHVATLTARIALVADDPELLFEIQEVSGGTALTSAAVGLNTNGIGTSGSTLTGLSSMELDNAVEADTETLLFRIVGLSKSPDNSIGEHAKWLVYINDHVYSHTATDAGKGL